MGANDLIRVRVSERVKSEWCDYASQSGISLSDFVRAACRVGALVGHDRMAAALRDLSSIRSDLHAASESLRRIAHDGTSRTSPDEVRESISKVHLAADAISTMIRGRQL